MNTPRAVGGQEGLLTNAGGPPRDGFERIRHSSGARAYRGRRPAIASSAIWSASRWGLMRPLGSYQW